ncbi:hypothetical protein FSP39_001038 [Pinctada imbricata]|uniref:Peptidase metallopeptidase domain-containing protein n=2 Tax=Pinctada TaxID=50425 RepID=A0AA88XYF9_PINIB|nr:hypothetical protein FSP39_001038 [Pinctada imbricata]
MKYGYMAEEDTKSGSLRSYDHIKDAIRNFQRFAGLKMTGIMDRKTREMMSRPRCGVKDDIGNANRARRRRRRYALHGSKWSKKTITYRVSKYSNKLEKKTTDKEIQRAFDVWSKVSPLTFRRIDKGRPDIDIRFEVKWHGDNNPFDGRGQTLAHAYFPRYGGDTHFDDDEPWTLKVPSGVNFFQVATHEFGHSLGLAHSDVYSALMAPFYKGYTRDFRLGRDDIEAIQALYGTPAQRPTPKPTKPSRIIPLFTPRPKTPRIIPRRKTTESPVQETPEVCRDSNIDAITKTQDGSTYVFKGKNYYRLGRYGIDKGYPRPIEWDWKGVKGPIDAALTWDNGYTYIFKGEHYWKYLNKRRIYGPNKITEGFDGVPGNLDAAVVWGGNGKTYFFKDNIYWRYSGRNVDYGYPRPISRWRGLPKGITAAFRWKNGRTYFFTGNKYYRYNDQLFTVDAGYPRSVATWWLGCPDQGKYIDIKDPSSQSNTHISENNPDEQWITIDGNTVKEAVKAVGNSACKKTSSSVLTSAVLTVACTVGRLLSR